MMMMMMIVQFQGFLDMLSVYLPTIQLIHTLSTRTFSLIHSHLLRYPYILQRISCPSSFLVNQVPATLPPRPPNNDHFQPGILYYIPISTPPIPKQASTNLNQIFRVHKRNILGFWPSTPQRTSTACRSVPLLPSVRNSIFLSILLVLVHRIFASPGQLVKCFGLR